MIFVTKPFLPPREEYLRYVDEIWERGWLTNHGPLVTGLEEKLREYLGVGHMLYLSNGTVALQIAIRALELEGEIITTPFSFVATTSTIVWEKCKPVFVDIDDTFNIDPKKIEAAIGPETSAILATHVYGNPCDIDTIAEIAKRHNLRVIYDGAHCFGTTYKGKSVFTYGDITTASFHATKLYHTIEGGGVMTGSAELARKLALLRNFGFSDYDKFDGIGINGKNSEFHAAMGLCNLPYIGEILDRRKELTGYYSECLSGMPLGRPALNPDAGQNHCYYPVVFETEAQLLAVKKYLEENQVFPRRYFYPALSRLEYVNGGDTPLADSIATRVLCLPLFHELTKEQVELVCGLLIKGIKSS